MSFFRHREIYRSDVSRVVRERCTHRPRPHRLDEFPAGYSLAGCSPTWPASASPARNHSALQLSFQSSVFHRTASSVLTICLSPGDHRTSALSCKQARCVFEDFIDSTSGPCRRRFSSSISSHHFLSSVPPRQGVCRSLKTHTVEDTSRLPSSPSIKSEFGIAALSTCLWCIVPNRS
jgi:hypothetical protein